MRSGRTTFLKIAFALSGAAVFSCLHAAESAPAPAPEKIEFSRSSTAPKIPRPGARTENRLDRFDNIPERSSQAPDMQTPMLPPQNMLSRAAAEKFLIEWDKKRNWAVPAGEDEQDVDYPLARRNEKEDEFGTSDRPKSRMEQFLTGEDESRRRTPGQSRLRDLDRDSDRRDNRSLNSRDRDDLRDDRKDEKDPRDPNDNSESNGLAEFNLKNFIRQQNGMPTSFLKDNPMPRASQLFRPEIGSNAFDQRQRERERAQRDARAAEFNQMIKPRLPGTLAGPSDPINAPDLTRREVNPITPRSFDSSPSERPSFGVPPPSPASRIQDNNMLGVTGPAASSAAPAVSAPLPRPDNTRSRQIVIEAPRRIGF